MLVADKTEQLVFDERAAERSACGVAMQLRNFVVGGNIGILLIEERRGIQPVRATMDITAAVNRIRAGCGAHVDVGAAVGALLRVVHGGVYAKFGDGFRSRRRQCLPDRQIDRCSALNRRGACTGRIRYAGIVHDASRSYLTGAFSIKQIAGIDAVQAENCCWYRAVHWPRWADFQGRCWPPCRPEVRRSLREKESRGR